MNGLIQSKATIEKLRKAREEQLALDERFMANALAQAKMAFNKGEVPIGAVIVKDGIIISKGYNKKEGKNCCVYHAEIDAIIKASKILGWRLDGTTMYVTVEPCPMCAGAIASARIKRLVFGACEPKSGACLSNYDILSLGGVNHTTSWTGGVLAHESLALMNTFFAQKRKNN